MIDDGDNEGDNECNNKDEKGKIAKKTRIQDELDMLVNFEIL